MFKFPTKLDAQTLRSVFRNHSYKRYLMRFSGLRNAAKRKGVFARLGMEVL